MNAISRSTWNTVISSKSIEKFRANRVKAFPEDWMLMMSVGKLNDGFEKTFGSRFQFHAHPEKYHLQVVSQFGCLSVAAELSVTSDAMEVMMDLTYVATVVVFGCMHEKDLREFRENEHILILGEAAFHEPDQEDAQ